MNKNLKYPLIAFIFTMTMAYLIDLSFDNVGYSLNINDGSVYSSTRYDSQVNPDVVFSHNMQNLISAYSKMKDCNNFQCCQNVVRNMIADGYHLEGLITKDCNKYSFNEYTNEIQCE